MHLRQIILLTGTEEISKMHVRKIRQVVVTRTTSISGSHDIYVILKLIYA